MSNFTSGPPGHQRLMANKLQFGAMGDYPLVVNGFTFENNPESKSRLIGCCRLQSSTGPATVWSFTRTRRTT